MKELIHAIAAIDTIAEICETHIECCEGCPFYDEGNDYSFCQLKTFRPIKRAESLKIRLK